MIKSLSPYYVNTPFVSPLTGLTCLSYTLNIYVWSGDSTATPTNPSYTILKQNPTGSVSSSEVNISRLINDFISFQPQEGAGIELINGNNQKWVRVEATYETTDPLDATTPQNVILELLVRGYGYGLEGVNPNTPSNKIMLTGNEFNVNRAGVFSLPLEMTNDVISVKSYPSLQINTNITTSTTVNSDEYIKNLWVTVSSATTDDVIEIIYNGVTTTLLVLDECRYTPIDVFFQNKEGAQQTLTFFKERKDDMSITSEEFESDRGQPSQSFHQYVKFNIQAKSKFKINSGFVSEDNNEVFKQLLLSEKVWIFENSSFIPVNVNSKSIEYLNRVNDRLIKYDIGFDFAYNEINNI